MIKVGTSIIILNSKFEVLLGKRKGSHGEGMWSLPGGHLEENETYVECCDRELMEEVNISFGEYSKVGFSEDFFPDKQYTTLYFAAKCTNEMLSKVKNMEPDKCEGWEWISADDIPRDLFCDSYNQIIKVILHDRDYLK